MAIDRSHTKKEVTLLAVSFAAVAAAGCSSGGGLPLAHDGSADGSSDQQTTVSFVNDVYPIVAASCALVECHAMSSRHEPLDRLHDGGEDPYALGQQSRVRLLHRRSGALVQRVTVVPGDPDASYLVTKIAPPTDEPCQDPTHHRRMPPDPLAPLSAESIGKVVQWIREGALLN